jgi:drug/metabolite transporter (DMT)-like permease
VQHAGEFAALGTALCWATGSNLFVAAGKQMGSVVLNRMRLTAGALFLGTALWVTHGSPWPTWATSSEVLILAASGLVGFVFGDTFYFRSLVILGAGRAALLASTSPILVAIMARVFMHETLNMLAITGIGVTLLGLAVVLYGEVKTEKSHPEGSALVGVVSGLLAALGQSVGYVLSKEALQQGLDPLSATVVRVGFAIIAVWLIAPLQGGHGRGLHTLRNRVALWTMLGGAFTGPFLGVTLSLVALQHTEAAIAAAITSCYPIPALLIASRFHSELVTRRTLFGAVITVGGLVLLFLHP